MDTEPAIDQELSPSQTSRACDPGISHKSSSPGGTENRNLAEEEVSGEQDTEHCMWTIAGTFQLEQ